MKRLVEKFLVPQRSKKAFDFSLSKSSLVFFALDIQ